MVVSDATFYRFLALIGICNEHCSKSTKFVVFFITAFYYLIAVHFVIASCNVMLYSNIKVGISYILLTVFSMFIWLVLFVKRKEISIIVQKLYRYREKYKVINSVSTFVQIVIFILFLMLFILSEGKHYSNDSKSNARLEFWSLDFKIPEGSLKISLRVFINLFNFVLFAFPVLLTFILSEIFYKWAETLQFYNRSLQLNLRLFKKHQYIVNFIDYFEMTSILREMIQVINYPLLCMIIYSLYNMFVQLYETLEFLDVLAYSDVLEFVIGVSSSAMMLVMYSLCSCMIPEKLS